MRQNQHQCLIAHDTLFDVRNLDTIFPTKLYPIMSTLDYHSIMMTEHRWDKSSYVMEQSLKYMCIFDEFGGNMPPQKIRIFMQNLLESPNPVLYRTYNPVVINEFKGEEEYCWVERDGVVVPLLDLHSHDWLAHFALGDLYDREEI